MKIVAANSSIPSMTREEAERFLIEGKLNLQIATIDEKGDPNIQPVWFYYDKDEEKISLKYLGTLDHPAAKEMADRSKNGEGVLVEISPKFFSTWDFGKRR